MLNISKHREMMLNVLKSVYEDTLLGPILGFKGGTLLYILYNLPRFSIDLDFDLLDFTKKDEVLEKLGDILKKYGRVDQLKDKKYTLFSLLNYQKGQRNLKIEISKRNNGNTYEIKNYLGISIKAMVKGDILANKLTALVNRKKVANRDIFDAWFMLKNGWDVNWGLIEKRSEMDKKAFIEKCISLLKTWPLTNILDGMGELLDNKTKDWVKKNLIKDTIFLLNVKLQA